MQLYLQKVLHKVNVWVKTMVKLTRPAYGQRSTKGEGGWICEPKQEVMLREEDEEDEKYVESLMECWKDLDQRKEDILEASTKMKESHNFETKDLRAYAGYVGYEDGKKLKSIIKDEENVDFSQAGKGEKERQENINI